MKISRKELNSELVNKIDSISEKIPYSEKGVPNGLALLDSNGNVIDGNGNTVEGKVTSVNGMIGDVVIDASLTKLASKNYLIKATTNSQTDFTIPLETFDIVTDYLQIVKNTTVLDDTKYSVNGRVITLNEGVIVDTEIFISIIKNVIAEDGKIISGALIKDATVELSKLKDKIPTLDINGNVLDGNGNIVEGKVKSVNGKTGDVVVEVFSGNYNDLINIPSSFTTSSHTHSVADVTGLTTTLSNYSTVEELNNHKDDESKHLTAEDRKKLDSLQIVKIYGVRIDKANSNPDTAVTYTDDAVGMTGGSSDWGNVYPFNQIKPCLLKDGVVQYYLNPNDFTKKLDGTNADITSGNDGDVMIEFPKIYWKITSDTSQVLVKYSDKQVDSTYKPLAHTKGATEKDKVYVGAYLGYAISSKLRSLSGKSPTVNQTIGTFRTQAQVNGIGYQQMGYYQLLMLQILYLVRFKNLDSQTALGRGYVDGNSASIATGGTNTKGMNFGETTGKQQMKFCGIEDYYGNCYYWIDGLFCDSSRNILIGNQNFNDNGSGYSNFGQGGTVNLNGYINDVQGGSEIGFIIKAASGSATTYYSDYGGLAAGYLPVFGAGWNDGSDGGAFQLRVISSASSSYANVSARLCYI